MQLMGLTQLQAHVRAHFNKRRATPFATGWTNWHALTHCQISNNSPTVAAITSRFSCSCLNLSIYLSMRPVSARISASCASAAAAAAGATCAASRVLSPV